MIDINTFEGIVQIRLSRELSGKPVFWVAAYLVDGLLIDTGCNYTAGELGSCLAKNPPGLAVNTHFHEDHIGANRLVQERFGISIHAHPDSLALIGAPAKLFPYQEIAWGYPEPSEVLPIGKVVTTKRFSFDVLETPGHSAGHIVLVERSRGWCFCGDIFASEKVKTIRPEEDMALTVSSLKKLIDLEMDRFVLFSSSGGIIERGREALQNYVRYLEDLSDRAKELYQRGKTPAEIVTGIFGGEHARAALTSGQYSTENLVRSVLKME
jgi:glyoxylase-like metal-dependent hydrolase (beta-lactamase superfamily II)